MADDRVGDVIKPAEKPLPEGVQTPKADFDRNREGLYGGRPEVRGGEKVPDK